MADEVSTVDRNKQYSINGIGIVSDEVRRIKTDELGRLLTMSGSPAPGTYDNGEVTYPNPTTEVYDFKMGVTTVATVTLTYTNATKKFLSTWAWS